MHNMTLNRPLRHDRSRPMALGPGNTIRLGVFFNDLDHCECHGDRVLYPNAVITWLLIREDPCGIARWHRQSQHPCLALATQAELRYGMPRIDFSGSCQRPALAIRSPQGAEARPIPPQRWMPRAFLGLPVEQASRLYARAVRESGVCRENEYPNALDFSFSRLGLFAQRQFGADRARGLPLSMPADVRYLGTRGDKGREPRRRLARGSETLVHGFQIPASGERYTIRLPAAARIHVRAGALVKAGECWCHDAWRAEANNAAPANAFHRTDGHLLQAAWLHSQTLRLQTIPGVVFFPAELLAVVARDLRPVALIWDLSPAEPHVDSRIDAALFPPMPLSHEGQRRGMLPGDVDLNADPGSPQRANAWAMAG